MQIIFDWTSIVLIWFSTQLFKNMSMWTVFSKFSRNFQLFYMHTYSFIGKQDYLHVLIPTINFSSKIKFKLKITKIRCHGGSFHIMQRPSYPCIFHSILYLWIQLQCTRQVWLIARLSESTSAVHSAIVALPGCRCTLCTVDLGRMNAARLARLTVVLSQLPANVRFGCGFL